jgi:hypothetical protein
MERVLVDCACKTMGGGGGVLLIECAIIYTGFATLLSTSWFGEWRE